MKPILPGDRGPAVEDVQRRLHALGYDLGHTGVDGVYQIATREAVVSFQHANTLAEDGVVGDETWSALVDATFKLGDRVLYLRLPYFHGHDVRLLQEAIGALGFSVGEVDGIFGPRTENAVREFQRNSGQPADGIAGTDTIRVIERLRHVWEGRSASTHVRETVGKAAGVAVFERAAVILDGKDDFALDVALRIINVALAMNPAARISLAEAGGEGDVTVSLTSRPDSSIGGPLVTAGNDGIEALAGRIMTALAVAQPRENVITVDLGPIEVGDHELQRISVRMFDALRLALAR